MAKVKFQIKNKWTGGVLFEYESDTIKEAVVKAVEDGANLVGADLSGANLSGAKGFHLNCPEEGAFIAFKKLKNGIIAKILVPAEAKRTSSTERKCRAEFVDVLELTKDDVEVNEGYDQHTGHVLYTKGSRVYPDIFNDDRRIICTNGIHFFITKQEAIDY